MAQVPRAYVDAFTRSMAALSEDVRSRLADALAKVDFSAPVADVREACIAAMELFCGPYSDMAAELAAEFYDGVREMATGARLGALAESGRVPEATEGAVRAIMQDLVDGKPAEGVQRKLLDRADYEVRKSANECVRVNAERDKVRYARVPSGSETCAFCIMLASRGAVYRSEELASHAHARCDCRVVPDFGDGIEGYDPDRYYDMWKHPEKYAVKAKKSVGAVYSDAYAARDREVRNANLDKLKQTQMIHIAGSVQSAKTALERGREPSCFVLGKEEVHKLIKTHAGRGEPDATADNAWNRKEICTADHVIGYVVTRKGDKIPTRCFKIHYSDGGVHAVPRYDEGGEPDDVG